MNKEMEKTLVENAKEYYKNALAAEEKAEFNTSVTLFFKAISALCDLLLIVKDDKMPSSHAERFRMLKENHPDIYKIIDNDFPFYQDSYRSKLNIEISKKLKNDAKILFELLNIRI